MNFNDLQIIRYVTKCFVFNMLTKFMTTYTILQAVISPNTDERINIGILLSDGEHTVWEYSDKKLDILRMWRGDAAYNMVKRISECLQSNALLREEIMQPSQLSYLQRYANNLVTVTPAQSVPSTLDTDLTSSLYNRVIAS